MLYTLNTVNKFVDKYQRHIKDIKITHFYHLDFHEMESCQYLIYFKIVMVDKYHNKLIKVLTNSTYMEDYGETEKEMKDNLLDSLLS